MEYEDLSSISELFVIFDDEIRDIEISSELKAYHTKKFGQCDMYIEIIGHRVNMPLKINHFTEETNVIRIPKEFEKIFSGEETVRVSFIFLKEIQEIGKLIIIPPTGTTHMNYVEKLRPNYCSATILSDHCVIPSCEFAGRIASIIDRNGNQIQFGIPCADMEIEIHGEFMDDIKFERKYKIVPRCIAEGYSHNKTTEFGKKYIMNGQIVYVR